MGRDEQRAAGSFVASARLNADKTILNQVDAPDGVAAADFIQQLDERNGIHRETVDGNWNALVETDFDLLFAVRRILRRLRQLPRTREGSVGGVFELSAFVADVPEVAIAAVNLRRGWPRRECRASQRNRGNLRATSNLHSRHGAIILSSGASAWYVSSKRT